MSPKALPRIARLALPVLLAAVVAGLGAMSVLRKVESFQPLGFSAALAGGAWRVDAALWPASGLQQGDQLLAVGGVPPASGAEIRSRLAAQASTELLVLRGGTVATVRYLRPPLEVDYRYLLLAFAGAVYLAIGLYTVVRHRASQGLLFFLWCAASAAVYLFTHAGPEFGRDLVGKALVLGEDLARLALPPLTLHLFLVFPRPLVSRRLAAVLLFLYLPAALLLAGQADLVVTGGDFLFGGALAAAQAALDRLGIAHLALYVVAAFAVLVHRLSRALEIEEQRQLRWLVVGLGAGYLPFVVLYAVPLLLRLPLPEALTTLAVAPLALVPLTFAYAILRYKLWDIETIVRDAVAWTLTLLFGVLGFSLINLYVSRGLAEQYAEWRSLLSFAAGLGIAGLVVPTRRSIGAALERLQYGGSLGKRRALAELGRELLHERDLDQLCASLLDHLEVGLRLEAANLYLAQRNALVAVRPGSTVPAQLPLEVLDDEAWQREVTAISGFAAPDGGASPLVALFSAGYRYAFPLTLRGNRVGILTTGYKFDQVPLSSEDIELLRQVLNQATLAIENAHLLDRLHQQLEELVHLKRYSDGIIESSPAGLAVLDGLGRVRSANLAFAALVGIERRSILGARLADVLPVALPQPEDGLVEARLPNLEGGERYLQLSVAELGEEGAGGRILIVQDTTERVAIERQLKEKDRLASLGMLAAGVAHEVNTPITGISSYAQMLLEETPEDDPRRSVLKKMERQTFRAARIVGSLLEFARNRGGEQRPVALARVLGEAAEEVEDRCRERGVRLAWRPPAEEIFVLGSATELAQVFVNLFGNALDAMRQGGSLSASLEADERRVWVAVEDTGVGIPGEQLEKIFQPFFSTKLSEGGTGLGLSISYEIVRRHGGEMRVISTPGEGSRFIVELPRYRPAMEA
jgi:hypothetical protein